VEKQKRRLQAEKNTLKPCIVEHYSKHLGYVDEKDQKSNIFSELIYL